MFSVIFRFEIIQHLKKPFTWIFLFLMILQGIYYMHHAGSFYSADQTYANAPAILYTVLAGVGYIGFIVTAILAGTAVGKDLEYKTAPLLFTTHASSRAYFAARYLGSFVILFLLCAGYLAGIICYNYLPVANMGPLSWGALGKALVMIFIPNVFILYTISFSLAVLTRNMRTAYAASMTGMLLMIFAETTFDSKPAMVLADPTAFSVLHYQLLHLSPDEKNHFSASLSGLLLCNRLIWTGLSLLLLFIAAGRFSFTFFSAVVQQRRKKLTQEEQHPSTAPVFHAAPLPVVQQRFSTGASWRQVASLSWLEFKTVVRPVGFKLFLSLILIIYICYVAVWQQQYYSTAPTLPVTIEVTGVTLPLSFYFLMFLIINTTELLFKNERTGFWQISDALPVPSWTSVLSKILAMVLVAFLLTTALVVFGIMVQAAKGYYNFEPMVYFKDLYLRWMPKYIIYILFTVFIAGITARRYATHWITILFLVISTIFHEIEIIEQHRFNFVFSPGSGMNTDMNGNGAFGLAHAWFMLYWFSLSMALAAAAVWSWQRGIPQSLNRRILRRNNQGWPLPLLFAGGLITFFASGWWIHQQINVRNRFMTKDEERAEAALYEKSYGKYLTSPQPRIKQLTLDLDLYPAERRLAYTALLQMEQPLTRGTDTLHISWMDFTDIDSLTIDGYSLQQVHLNKALRYAMYKLDHPVLPGQSATIHIRGKMQYSGFTNDDPQQALVFNGSFIPADIIPYFGYDERRILKENQYRVQYGLSKLSTRLSPVSDTVAASQLFASTQEAGRISYTLHVSTDSSQIIVAPGIRTTERSTGDRRHYTFSSAGATFDFHILSARYRQTKQQLTVAGKTLTIEIYSHPEHPYNVTSLINSAHEALDYLSGIFGPYPYPALQIAERPRYDELLTTSGNLIVLPEHHGWIADVKRKEDLDYLRYITARAIAAQYMREANISRTQGYPVFTTAIPGYLALLQLERYYGKAALQHHLDKQQERYLKGRAAETNTEPSLWTADEDASYVQEFKGPPALYKLSELIGSRQLNTAVAQFLSKARSADTMLNVAGFYHLLATQTGKEYQDTLRTLFKDNKPFELKVK
ncbi:hypothetical protein ECE50_008655 [Chitinophaga sp. Mgbs1]|uniref:Uncharacterized protein n=1 Tax=Chitinophaga solisilvae TaxID=1233460 RepID=A0A3S1B2Q9_9BACT|nr:hypothetical protein [Chitinophaga solisilvae]